MADIQETLFKAIDEIVGKRIEAVRFDETIKAIVVDASAAADGKYVVDTGATQFTAYSMTEYKENDTVLVTIPQGNYDNQKMIIGKSVNGTDTPLIIKRPFDDFIDLTHNIASNLTGTISYQANGENYIWQEGASYPTEESYPNNNSVPIPWTWGFDTQGQPGYDGQIQKFTRLGVQAQFSTWLSEYNIMEGNYGLALQIFFKSNDNNEYFTQILTLDSDTFFGNPYDFETYYTQEEVFDISDLVDFPIVGLKLFPYQRNNFTTITGERLDYNDADAAAGFFSTAGDNIFIKDVNICFGKAAEEFEYDTAEIMCDSSLTYRKTYETGETFAQRAAANNKIIQLRWIHKDDETEKISMVDDLPSGYEIRWYKYELGAPSPDKFAGAHWTRFYGSKITVDETVQETENWDNDDSNDITTDKLEIKLQPNVNLETEQIKAIVIKTDIDSQDNPHEKKIAISNILEFTNDDEVRNQTTLIDANALSIRYNDDEKGHYFLYDESGDIGAQEDLEIRTITAVFDPSGQQTNVYDKPELNIEDCYSITWTFPSGNTMIVPMSGITPDATPLEEGHVFTTKTNTVGFTIKKHLNNNATSNTILLEIVTGGQNYLAQIQPIFGTAGSNGSDYTLIINWRDGKNALNLSTYNNDGTTCFVDGNSDDLTKTSLVGDVILFDQAGNTIPIPKGASISCNWKVAEFGNTNVRIKEKETENLLYPVFTGTDDSRLLVYNLSDNPDENYQGEGFYYFLEDTRISGVSYYIYSIENKQFVVDTTSTIAGKQLYRKKQANETAKNKLEYIPVQFAEDPLNQETGIVSTTYNNTPITINNGEKLYHYSQSHKYFIKIDDQYILDPWDTYQEVETYYEPIEAKENQYVLDAETGYILYNGSTQSGGLAAAASTEDATVTITASTEANINSLFVLEVKLEHFGDYDLTAYYPIALKNGETKPGQQKTKVINYIEGPDRVRYGSSGETDFDKNVYQITIEKWETNHFTKYRHGYQNNEHELDGYWKLLFPQRLSSYEDGFQPKLQETVIDSNTHQIINYLNDVTKFDIPKLNPVSIYIPDAIPYGVQFVEKVDNNPLHDIVLWTQPILVWENKYPSATLNKWNGKDIQTDDEEGTIVASGFAAGKKERDNTFTGVIIGDWSRSKMDTAVSKNTGVYGFNHGAMSYAFKDDGTGFIGKDGKGRIYLDGDKSQIYSSRWANTNAPEGMLLDIDDGYIKMEKSVISYNYTWVNQNTAKTNLTTAFDTWKSTYYYYANGNYFPVEGNLTEYDATYTYYTRTQINSSSKYITLGVNQQTFPLSIGTTSSISGRKFKVAWDGTAYIQDGHFAGTITGSEVYTDYLESYNGLIGGWTIGQSSLSGGSTTLDSSAGITTNFVTISGTNVTGQIGQIIGSDGQNLTNLLGVQAKTGGGVALEAPSGGNIRLSGPGSGISCARIDLQANIIQLGATASAVYIGPLLSPWTTDGENLITFRNNVLHIYAPTIQFHTPATGQSGIYARFA